MNENLKLCEIRNYNQTRYFENLRLCRNSNSKKQKNEDFLKMKLRDIRSFKRYPLSKSETEI